MYACPCSKHNGKVISSQTFYNCKNRKRPRADAAMQAPQVQVQAPQAPRPDAKVPSVHFKVAKELMEQVVRRKVTAAGVTDILKIMKHYYGNYMPKEILKRFPSSWYKVKKLASDGTEPTSKIRDVCPTCSWIFPVDTDMIKCVRCRKDTRWHPKKRYGARSDHELIHA